MLECYNKYPDVDGYRFAKLGINSKIKLEDLSPKIFDSIMGQDYRGVELELKKEEEDEEEEKEKRDGRKKKNMKKINNWTAVNEQPQKGITKC